LRFDLAIDQQTKPLTWKSVGIGLCNQLRHWVASILRSMNGSSDTHILAHPCSRFNEDEKRLSTPSPWC
jgi:hypothetical protein